MFLTSPNQFQLEDFLKAVSFIPPSGMSVDYILMPNGTGSVVPSCPVGSGFEKNEDLTDESVTVFQRVDPAKKIDQASTPEEYAETAVPDLAISGPKAPVIPRNTPIEALQCPYAKVVADDPALGTADVILTESWKMFPKNTLFHLRDVE